jgi:multidrug resistance efflux pump
VQRIPVRIAIDPGSCTQPLRSGMSADVEITTGGKHRLSDLLPSFLVARAATPGTANR